MAVISVEDLRRAVSRYGNECSEEAGYREAFDALVADAEWWRAVQKKRLGDGDFWYLVPALRIRRWRTDTHGAVR